MPDIKLICEKCNSERFNVTSDVVFSETISSIVCAVCKHPVNVHEVVTFREIPYLTLVPDLQIH
ncbi:UNVERIFIED_ORG: transcription elongation factor Elf1 [Rahnella aquatilis]|jgi:transcription elongation factor Elf1|nr:hypothetical protein SRABI106_02316 [Rahnella aquatilis]